jgi:hypothetical protein
MLTSSPRACVCWLTTVRLPLCPEHRVDQSGPAFLQGIRVTEPPMRLAKFQGSLIKPEITFSEQMQQIRITPKPWQFRFHGRHAPDDNDGQLRNPPRPTEDSGPGTTDSGGNQHSAPSSTAPNPSALEALVALAVAAGPDSSEQTKVKPSRLRTKKLLTGGIICTGPSTGIVDRKEKIQQILVLEMRWLLQVQPAAWRPRSALLRRSIRRGPIRRNATSRR